MVILDVLQKREKWGIFLITTNYNGTKEFNNCTLLSEEEKEQMSLTNMYQNKNLKMREKGGKIQFTLKRHLEES